MELRGLWDKYWSFCGPFVSKQVRIESYHFRDVIPTDPEDDFPHQVVRIAYSPEFKDCFDYFRAITEKGELSQGIGPKQLFSLTYGP